MKKAILAAAALFALAACHNDPQASAPNLSLGLGTMGQLKVVYSAAVSPDWVGQEIVVNATPEIIRVVNRGTAAGGAEKMCMGAAPLKEEEYRLILDLIEEAHLASYAPPTDCEALVGATGVQISYQLTGGERNSFTAICEPEPAIAALIDEIDSIADASIPDCNVDEYLGAPEPATEDEPEPVAEPETVEEEEPVFPQQASPEEQA